MVSEEFLTVSDLTVSYGATRVFDGLNLGVKEGEFVALLGSSGCGKTTLLRAISGFADVKSGQVRIGGKDITRLPPDRRDMAMVFQSFALWPHMTVFQNIAYGLRLRRWSRDAIRARVDEILDMLGLHDFGGRSISQLSGGQKQRVALGRALAVNPQILLLDEPLSSLDARIRVSLRHEVRTIQKALGITAIHVTHDREEAMVMADRIALMREGRIEQFGTPQEIYERPKSPFVADFMGASNRIEVSALRNGEMVEIPKGLFNAPAQINKTGVTEEWRGYADIVIYFHGGSARLVDPGEPTKPNELALYGTVKQNAYPGGFFRYTINVGSQDLIVDSTNRVDVDSNVILALPGDAMHIYANNGDASASAPAQTND